MMLVDKIAEAIESVVGVFVHDPNASDTGDHTILV